MEKKKKIRIWEWFLNQRLWKKVLYAFLVSSIIPLIAVQSIMFYANSTSVKEKIDELMVEELIQMAERVDLTLDMYSNLVYQICSDDQLTENINEQLDKSDIGEEVAKWKIYDQIRQYDILAEGIQCISIILKDGQQITYDFVNASTVQSIWDGYTDMRESAPYMEAHRTSGIAVTPMSWQDASGGKKYLFHISKKIYDYEEPEKGAVAVVILSIDGAVLDKICTVDARHDPKQEYNVNFIMDGKGNILSYPDISYTGTKISSEDSVEKFVQRTGRLKGKRIAANQYEDKKLGWVFCNVYDKKYMLNSVWDSLGFAVCLAAVFTSFAVCVIVTAIRPIKRSFQSLMEGIRKVEGGDLSVKIAEDAGDEFGEIARAFNQMTGKLKGQFAASADAARKQREAEVRALEAQINPHFLYNTLDSINWMAIDKGEYEISKMLRDLGVILRYSVNKSNQLAKIEEVADWLEKYVELQQLRFNHSFSFDLYVEEDAKTVRIYKLLLQPFIENSIIHGFKEIVSGGVLRVSIMLSEDRHMLHVIIEDNGSGMKPEQVKKYNDRETVLHQEDERIGLENAFMRMYLYYGEEAAWNVSSILHMGTVVTLKIPVKEDY